MHIETFVLIDLEAIDLVFCRSIILILACSFEQHGVCVGFILGRFKWNRQAHCLSACHSFNYYIDNVHVSKKMFFLSYKSNQYTKMQQETENLIRTQLNLTDDIRIAGAEIHLSEKINWKQVETESYPFTGTSSVTSYNTKS